MQEVHGHVYYCHHIFDENDDMSDAKQSVLFTNANLQTAACQDEVKQIGGR